MQPTDCPRDLKKKEKKKQKRKKEKSKKAKKQKKRSLHEESQFEDPILWEFRHPPVQILSMYA